MQHGLYCIVCGSLSEFSFSKCTTIFVGNFDDLGSLVFAQKISRYGITKTVIPFADRSAERDFPVAWVCWFS